MALSGPDFFLDRASLVARARTLAPTWASASPHPHAVLDGLFGAEISNELASLFPAPGAARWKFRDYAEQRRYGHLQQSNFADVAPPLRHALAELNGQAFLDFLEALTGIRGLIADPHFVGGGLHLTPPGGFLGLHTDFNVDARRGLKRVLTAIVYLNPDWLEEWGGHLELWRASATRADARIAPLCDRLVVMAQGESHFHGHPTPLACPPDRFRASLATYYFVADPDAAAAGHGVVWLNSRTQE